MKYKRFIDYKGVVINDKHIEVIVRQMLKKVEIKVPGDSKYLSGEIIDKNELEEENENLTKDKKKASYCRKSSFGYNKSFFADKLIYFCCIIPRNYKSFN